MITVTAKRALLSSVVTLGALLLAACGGNTSGTETSSAGVTAAAAADSAVELAGTSWNLSAFTDDKGTEVPGTTGANMGTLAFAADGTYSGSTGCNRIVGAYKQDGSALTLESGPMTKMACPPDVTVQEDAVIAALPKVTSFTSGTALVLSNAEGGTLLTYAPGTAGLAGTSWSATGINNGKDAVVGQAGTEKVTIEFGTDGTVSGSSGCNTYTGTYTSDAGAITFGPLAQTMMACDEPIMQIEQQYSAALAAATAYVIDGATLTLRDDTGATQVTFAQS